MEKTITYEWQEEAILQSREWTAADAVTLAETGRVGWASIWNVDRVDFWLEYVGNADPVRHDGPMPAGLIVKQSYLP